MSTLSRNRSALVCSRWRWDLGSSVAELLSATDRHPTEFRKISPKVWKDQESSLTSIESGGVYRLWLSLNLQWDLKEYSKAPINLRVYLAALETLSIIARKQPITWDRNRCYPWSQLEGALAKLQAFWLDTRRCKLGRPNLYVTTDYSS